MTDLSFFRCRCRGVCDLLNQIAAADLAARTPHRPRRTAHAAPPTPA